MDHPESAARRPATIYDVARMAGVSHQTVSRFLSGTGGIRPANRERVEQALLALNYRKNMTARSLATNRTYRLGALGYELAGTGTSKTMQGASEAARRAGYSLDIVSLDPMKDTEIGEALDVLQNRDLEGIIATAPTDAIREALDALNLSVPIYVDRGTDFVSAIAQGTFPDSGVFAALAHLVDLGHTRIAHLAGPADWISARQRVEAYEYSLAHFGLPALPIVSGDWSSRSGYRAADGLLSLEPTAVFAANDRMALGVMKWMHEQGMRIPDDVSVLGFDDLAEAEFFHPSLTTVRQDFDAMGRAAAETLIAMIERPGAVPDVVYPKQEFISRESTGPSPRR
ncbi:MAG: LacI family DNA-binding transcriptional regulator [Pseudoclavibacter sp.]